MIFIRGCIPCRSHNKLCHGDFNPSNIIVTDSGVPYIIDWSHATQGNASADAARTYLLFWLDGDIAGADRYLELFCLKSNTEKRYVQKWMPIVAASQTVKGNEKEREFLNSWIKCCRLRIRRKTHENYGLHRLFMPH